MFYKQKSNVLFRNYDSFGYITDNRNFGYKRVDNNENYIGDKILSASGAVFFSTLRRKSKSLDEIVKNISEQFPNVDIRTITKDAKEFFSMLEQEGFLISGETIQECENKDTRFSYKISEPEIYKKDFTTSIIQPERTTQEFLEDYYNGKPLLTSIHIEIISRCNERCIHCYIPHDKKQSFMEPELFYNILEQCKNMKLLHLTLSGGEPMMHKNFCDFLRICKELDFSVSVLSNLTLLNEEIINEMKTNPLLGVQVTLYSMNPNIHDKITQTKGSFKKTIDSILKLIENDIPLQINCPIMKENKNCYKDVIKWAKKHNIYAGDDYIIIARYDHSTKNLSCRLSINEIKEVIVDKITLDKKYLEEMETESEKKKNNTENDFVCSVCHSSICIADNGNVYPCAGWQDYVVGNVKETSLNDIWDNSDKVNYLRNIRNQDFSKCNNCTNKEFCTICMVRNANENPQGDPFAVSEYFCKIAKLNKEIILEWKGKFIR